MNICTWIYCDEEHEESEYPQVGKKSSHKKFQEVYWRCVATFFATSCRNNPKANHFLFTNVDKVPEINGFNLDEFLTKKLQVKLIKLSLTYRTPDGYYGSWKNQFYLFDILKHIVSANSEDNANYVILDSDCVWLRSADEIESKIDQYGLLTMTADVDDDTEFVMNGLSRNDMRTIYEEMLGRKINHVPYYFGGEWFAANVREIKKVVRELDEVWEENMERYARNKAKFNEEAQMLSYVYYKLGYKEKTANRIIKRMWTQLKGFNNVVEGDRALTIWHLPSEKKLGLARLYREIICPDSFFWSAPDGDSILNYMSRIMGIPKRSFYKTIIDAKSLLFGKVLNIH